MGYFISIIGHFLLRVSYNIMNKFFGGTRVDAKKELQQIFYNITRR